MPTLFPHNIAPRHSSARESESRLVYLQGLLPCVAPLLPHLAEDAWENLPWPVPTKSVFQAGWFHPSANWTSLAQVCHQNKDHRKKRALLNPETSISIQKRHSYTRNLNSETSGDSKNAFLHCGDGLVLHLTKWHDNFSTLCAAHAGLACFASPLCEHSITDRRTHQRLQA